MNDKHNACDLCGADTKTYRAIMGLKKEERWLCILCIRALQLPLLCSRCRGTGYEPITKVLV